MERRSSRVSHAQWEIILTFLAENPSLVRGYHNSCRGREQANRLWNCLANQLNAEGSGASKTAKEWATYLNNFKSKLKKTVSDLNREATATGGGPPMVDSLSEIERRLLSIMGPGFGQGLPSVRVNPFPDGDPTGQVNEDQGGHEEESVIYVIQTENQEQIELENAENTIDLPAGSSEILSEPTASLDPPPQSAPPAQAAPPQPNVPALERRTRRVRNRTRPLAPIDEARRILSEIERQRAASDAANARAMESIAENLGRIASAMERYLQGQNQN